MFYDESGSATKKFDYIKLGYSSENNIELSYNNGLNCKAKGKCPISRKFKFKLDGDNCDDIDEGDSYENNVNNNNNNNNIK